RAKVDAVVYDEIRRARERDDIEDREDILSLLLQARHEDGSRMSDEELRDELMTLLLAGHETTATSLAWAIERLVRHPEAMRRRDPPLHRCELRVVRDADRAAGDRAQRGAARRPAAGRAGRAALDHAEPAPRRPGRRRLMARLTRKEFQARTRSQLLEAAGKV